MQPKQFSAAKLLGSLPALEKSEGLKVRDFGLFQISAKDPGGMQFLIVEPMVPLDGVNLPFAIFPMPNRNREASQNVVRGSPGQLRRARLVDITQIHKKKKRLG